MKLVLALFASLVLFIQVSYGAGGVDVSSGLTLSPSTVTIDQEFMVSFSLKEYIGESKNLEYIQLWIQNGSGQDLFMAKDWGRQMLRAGEIRHYSTNTSLDKAYGRTTGAYRAIVRAKISGDANGPFNFQSIDRGVNPVSFNAVLKSDSTGKLCDGNHQMQHRLGQIVLGKGYSKINFGYLCKYPYSISQLKSKNLPTYHAGIDYAATPGQEIYAAVSGMLRDSGSNSWGEGMYIEPDIAIKGEQGRIFYLHTKPATRKYNKHVNAGEFIGTVSDAGANHLHIEMRNNNYTRQYAVGRTSCGTICDEKYQVDNLTTDPGILAEGNSTSNNNNLSIWEKINPVFNFIEEKYGQWFYPHKNTMENLDTKPVSYYRRYTAIDSTLYIWTDGHLWYKINGGDWTKTATLQEWYDAVSN